KENSFRQASACVSLVEGCFPQGELSTQAAEGGILRIPKVTAFGRLLERRSLQPFSREKDCAPA
ncbi:MAG TPA: hypothetical protein DEP23_10275, partial [Ruminococcaceae bacterium]|nr:hypothetical protein [Oscillospiraceae bacterium]